MVNAFNIVSWNVKGLNHPMKRKKVFSHLKHLRSKIVFLQETHVRTSNLSLLLRWSGQSFHSMFQAKARGVSILISQDIPFEPHNVLSDNNGRYIILSGKLYNILVVLVNVYVPNVDDAEFFKRLFSLLPDLNTYHLILGGDLNCWLDPTLDRSSGNPGAVNKSTCLINDFLTDFGICDVWRFLHPNDKEFSFFSQVHHSYSRIDYFLLDNQLIPSVHSCEYQPIVISDCYINWLY
ncbi:hypothetical protein NQD34_009846 [Periophthalmus magnuspinnatus]|nr:hypothetical protein NQD34_009846 [Periophthalmus magnuspinnatus]